jgi:hypothetical protein
MEVPQEKAAEILLSFCRYHSVHADFVHHNPAWTEMLLDGRVPCGMLEKLFAAKKDKPAFLESLEAFVTTELNKTTPDVRAFPPFEMKGEQEETLPEGTRAYRLKVHFEDGLEAILWKGLNGGLYYFFDPELEDYLSFEKEQDCLESVYGIVKNEVN